MSTFKYMGSGIASRIYSRGTQSILHENIPFVLRRDYKTKEITVKISTGEILLWNEINIIQQN